MSNIWNNFTEYIINNYSNASKIVEVGVGKTLEPSNILKSKLTHANITIVDIHPANDRVTYDDICNPNDTIYKNSDLIYSIRPPEELQLDIFNLGKRYNCDIIIKPLFTEEINLNLQNKLKLVNHKRTAFYVYKESELHD